MLHWLLLPVHIGAGVLAILSGTAAISFRKGSSRHALAGQVFVAAMLTMSAAAVYLAILKHQTPNIVAGILSFYMIATAWLTVFRKDGKPGVLDWGALLIPLVGGAWMWSLGLGALVRHAPIPGVPMVMPFFVGSVMLLAGAGDIRMIARGLSGKKRLVRHLWRMCFGLFIATGSFFLGQQKVFPVALRGSILLLVLAILPLPTMIFWLIRVRRANWGYRRESRVANALQASQSGA
jgi:hypothetical protein